MMAQNLDKLLSDYAAALRSEIADQIYDRFDPAVSTAANEAITTVNKCKFTSQVTSPRILSEYVPRSVLLSINRRHGTQPTQICRAPWISR